MPDITEPRPNHEQDTTGESNKSIFTDNDFAGATENNGIDSNSIASDISERGDDGLRDIQDLTLAGLLATTLRSPVRMVVAFWDVLKPDSYGHRLVSVGLPTNSAAHYIERHNTPALMERVRAVPVNRQFVQVVVWLLGFAIALVGNLYMAGDTVVRRSESIQLAQGLPYLFIGALVWLMAEVIGKWPDIVRWWQRQAFLGYLNLALRAFPIGFVLVGLAVVWDSTDAPTEDVLRIVTPGVQLVMLGGLTWFLLDIGRFIVGLLVHRKPGLFPPWMQNSLNQHQQRVNAPVHDVVMIDPRPWYMKIHPTRLVLILVGVLLSMLIWFGTSGNHFDTPIFYLWLLSAGVWSLVFAPNLLVLDWVTARIDHLRRLHIRPYFSVIVVFLVIVTVGWYFRFHDLREHPREMTDDHVEKILDSALVRDGLRPIFFANNGGREPFQMYAIALASYLPGMGIDHFTIKTVAAVESLFTIPLMFWMAYELLEGESQRRRLLVGIIAAALMAASYWHVAITRQGLRIALTPLVVALLLVYLARALRRNSRTDFIKAGLVLGFGLYTYQAVRMLPIVIVIAVGLAFYFVARNWKERWRYAFNLAVLVWISFIVFIPMFHYSVEYPDLFWRRTTGRLLGDDVIEETLDNGTIVMREASVQERLDAFRANVPVLMNNIRNVLLMFNWKGDVAAISGVPNQPAMDILSGTLLIVGLAAWAALMIRRRDVTLWLMPIFILVMLLPSALSIAFPVENPSHTRTSGAMPGIYLVAALPLALVADALMDARRKRLGRVAAAALCTVIIVGSYSANAYIYFEVYPQVYADSFDPYTEPGYYLRGFALSGGSYGNAFMIGYQHWWSHRAIGLAAGLETLWPNGVVAREDIPRMLRDGLSQTDNFRFDPNRDILFFYAPKDTESGVSLAELFPQGYTSLERTYARNNDYMVYRVPALGEIRFEEWLTEHLAE